MDITSTLTWDLQTDFDAAKIVSIVNLVNTGVMQNHISWIPYSFI